MPDLSETPMESSLTGAPYTHGVGKICDFSQITRYILETIQEMNGEYEVVCAVSNDDIVDTLNCPSHPKSPTF